MGRNEEYVKKARELFEIKTVYKRKEFVRLMGVRGKRFSDMMHVLSNHMLIYDDFGEVGVLTCTRNMSYVKKEAKMEWISVDKDMPEHKEEASVGVLWAVIKGDKIKAWGKGSVGTDGEWYKGGISLNWIPTHWAFVPAPPSSHNSN